MAFQGLQRNAPTRAREQPLNSLKVRQEVLGFKDKKPKISKVLTDEKERR